MKLNLSRTLVLLSGVAASTLALATEADMAGHAAHSGTNLGPLAAAIAIGMGAFGAATAQGRAASSALEGVARNPSSRNEVFMPLILSLVFMELQALLCFVIAFMVKG